MKEAEMASMTRWSSLVVLAGLVLLTPPPAGAVTASVSTACSGTGIQGSVVDGSTSIYFKVCPETSPCWRFESWNSGGDITELPWNTSTSTGTAWVGGVELTSSRTQAQQDRMMGMIGCWGCLGACTQACLDHDCCQRANGFFSCLGGLFSAIGSLITAL